MINQHSPNGKEMNTLKRILTGTDWQIKDEENFKIFACNFLGNVRPNTTSYERSSKKNSRNRSNNKNTY